MPRISRELAAKKESFVAGLFATNPTLTIREVQEALKVEFQQTMNPATILKLKGNITRQDSPIVVNEQVETTVATEVKTEADPSLLVNILKPEDTTPVAVVATETVTETPVTTVGELAAEEVVRQVRSSKDIVRADGTVWRELRPGLHELVKE